MTTIDDIKQAYENVCKDLGVAELPAVVCSDFAPFESHRQTKRRRLLKTRFGTFLVTDDLEELLEQTEKSYD